MIRRAVLAALLLAGPAFAQGHGGPVRALAVGPLGAASGGLDQAVIFWSPQGQARLAARWHRGAVEALLAIPGGGFASAGEDGRIAIWPPTGAPAPDAVLEGHEGPVSALASDGTVVASGGFDGTVRLWRGPGDADVLRGHQGPVTALAATPRGFVSGGQDGTLRLWPGGEVLAEFGLPVTALAALPEGVAAGLSDGSVRLLEAGGTRELAIGTRPIIAMAIRAGLLAAGGVGGEVAIWDWNAARLLRVLEGPGLPVWSLGFAPDGTLWTGGADAVLRRWNPLTGRPISETPAAAPLPEGLDPEGARVWRYCQACHALRADAPPMAGPHLQNLFGRRMGSVPGYDYSERLARGDIIWDENTVAELFTQGPDLFTPGTRMPVQRLSDPDDMAALIRFLRRATATP
ncbi:hypothetical protein EOD42_24940 [Rhodovarius crocodyli]|uniref:Cytochrome c domain-containing protein n=1 Tax=Rhodovarius crocodyli TaxID=1979269 RepID=A0A437LW89_9PROT|nr:c-type cytochrome [Rhodovarius crocodyli]RVT89646.1 hypothetical protein EOD42_24940 [Rhodovarius crocodyli]